MTKDPQFAHLTTNTMNPCHLSAECAREARQSWLCPGCGRPHPSSRNIAVSLQDLEPEDSPLNFVYGCGVSLARVEFLLQLGEALVASELRLGQVRTSRGGLVDGWVTWRARHQVAIRGSKAVTARRCATCHRAVYFASGRRHLSPAPPHGVRVLESDLHGLVLETALARQLDLAAWPKLDIEWLPVIEPALDGLGSLDLGLSEY